MKRLFIISMLIFAFFYGCEEDAKNRLYRENEEQNLEKEDLEYENAGLRQKKKNWSLRIKN